MKNRTISHTCLALVLLLVFFPFLEGSASAADCLSSSETREAINAGRATHLAAIKEAASKVVRGDVIKVKLCQGGDGLVYQLITLSRQGAVTQLELDAITGKVVSK